MLYLSMLLPLSCGRSIEVVPLPPLPGAGLSGLYAGEINGTLYVAGGCNFPGKALTDGGEKVYYSDIWKLDGEEWVKAGRLPEPSAYGAYLTVDKGIMILGGANSQGTLDTSWMVTADGVHELETMPKPLEQMAWCTCGSTVYVAGGMSCGTPSLELFKFQEGVWSVVGVLPRPLVQGIICTDDDALYIFGGFDPLAKEAVKGGYAVSLEDGCITAIPADMTFVGSAALASLVCGGCDAEVFTQALNLHATEVRDYQLQPAEYYKFRPLLLRHGTEGWSTVAKNPAFARAGAALASYQDGIVFIGGEIKPGIRTQEVWMIK